MALSWSRCGAARSRSLFYGKAAKTNTEDVAWDAATRTVYVPNFFLNSVLAFKFE